MNLRCAVLCILVGTTMALSQSQPLLQITAPASGTIFYPGQTVLVSVVADPSVLNIAVTMDIQSPNGFAGEPDASGQFSLTIPANTPIGPYKITASGTSPKVDDLAESQPVTISVENPLPIISLKTISTSLRLNPGDKLDIDVVATFSDGSKANVSRSTHTSFQSQDASIAMVGSEGEVTALSLGSTTVTAANGGLQTTVDVIVDAPRPPLAPEFLPPHTTAVVSPQPNAAGWNNSDVTVTFNATAQHGGSEIKQIIVNLSGAQKFRNVFPGSTATVTVSAEGVTTLDYYSVTTAGSMDKIKPITVQLDKTPPVLLASPMPAANANGWNNTNVTVSFTCTDALSGIASNGGLPGTIVLSNDGANQQVTGTCQDVADNVASATIAGINIDKTPPVITGMPSGCSLWPPNHKLVQVGTIGATGAPSGLATFNVNVSSNEPDGDQPEFLVSGSPLQPQTVQLKAERSGNGTGRVYTITAAASDLAGNVANSSATCTVPHDQSRK
ncbi:MAG TPA: hypothetical protein VI685_15050 [Candidatus Angelobacter sp.]